jgi:hypothetical protein
VHALLSRVLLSILLTGVSCVVPVRSLALAGGPRHSDAPPNRLLTLVRGRTRPPLAPAPTHSTAEIGLNKGPTGLSADEVETLSPIGSVSTQARTRHLLTPYLRRSQISLRC